MKKSITHNGIRILWNSEFQEYRVKAPSNAHADYFTSDYKDAIQTAEAMQQAEPHMIWLSLSRVNASRLLAMLESAGYNNYPVESVSRAVYNEVSNQIDRGYQ